MRPAVAGPWLFPVRLAPSPFGDQRALPSVGERPQPELLLGDLPEPRQAVRLDDKEEDDQGAEHHEFQVRDDLDGDLQPEQGRSEENTSELQSLMRTQYAVVCLKKQKT